MHSKISKFTNPVPLQSLHECMTHQDTEPDELRELKYLLAHLNCNCETCATCNTGSQHHKTHRSLQPTSPVMTVQTDQINCLGYTCVEVIHEPAKENKRSQTQASSTQLFNDNLLCPTCQIVFGLLRGAITKVCKDEETETVRETKSCDKFTSRELHNVDRTTSMTSKLLESPNASDISGFSSGTNCLQSSASSRVRFQLEQREHSPRRQAHHLNCTCLKHFVDSIIPQFLEYRVNRLDPKFKMGN